MRGAVRRLMAQDKWIISFVGAHAAIGMLSAFWIRRFGRAPFPNDVVSWEMVGAMRVFVSLGMLVGLAILLGIWAALGTSHWMARTAGFVVGVGCSGLLSCMSTSRYSFTECSAEVGSAVCVAVALWMVRRAGIGVRRLTASESKSGGMQLSIRQLMFQDQEQLLQLGGDLYNGREDHDERAVLFPGDDLMNQGLDDFG